MLAAVWDMMKLHFIGFRTGPRLVLQHRAGAFLFAALIGRICIMYAIAQHSIENGITGPYFCSIIRDFGSLFLGLF